MIGEKIAGVQEWCQVSVDEGRVRVAIGDEMTADGADDYWITLSPDKALELAIELLEKGYTAKGEDVTRLLVLLNPEIDEEPEETPAGDLPS